MIAGSPDAGLDSGPESGSASGLRLAERYAAEVVGPLLESARPGLAFGLARLGSGSDVLGLDDATSRDHDWGLRLTVVVPEPEVEPVAELLESRLPESFLGHPVRFATTWEPVVRQRAEVVTAHGFATSRTGLDLRRDLDAIEWLSLTGQAALELTAGPVFRDGTGELATIRERLRWYPDDLWLHVLAADWARIGQELPFVGRTADRGDEAGSAVIAARLARTLLHLGFLLERRWPPYAKWLGTGFAALPHASSALPGIVAATAVGADWRQREAGLVTAIEVLAELQGSLDLPTVAATTEPFWDRRYRGLGGLPEATRAAVRDPAIRALPPLGSVEQWADSVDLLVDGGRRLAATRALYG